MTLKETINFYLDRDKYGEFSNFFRGAPFRHLLGGAWSSSEHFFQAMKFVTTDLEWAKEIQRARTPAESAKMGRDRKHPLREDWEDIKDDVMRVALFYKFTQNPALMYFLRGTKDAILVEHTVNDAYWGDGGDGTGKNMLGKLLMEIRDTENEQKKGNQTKDLLGLWLREHNGWVRASYKVWEGEE